MKDLRKPDFMIQNRGKKKRSSVAKLMVGFLLFMVGSLVASVVQIPFYFVYLFSNEEYMNMVTSPTYKVDFDKIMQIMTTMPSWMLAAVLFSEAGLIITVMVFSKNLEKNTLKSIGITKKKILPNYLLGLVIGFVAFAAAFLICVGLKAESCSLNNIDTKTALYILLFFVGFMVQGFAEELLCRGYLFTSFARDRSVIYGMIMNSVIFAILHGVNTGLTPLALLNLFMFGIVMSLIFVRYENIWIIAAIHTIWNFVQGNVFGVQVSGIKGMPSIFTATQTEGADFVNGGDFGLEGGMAVTIVLLIIIAVVGYSLKKKNCFVDPSENLKRQSEYDESYPLEKQFGPIVRVYNQNGTYIPNGAYYQKRMNNQNSPYNQNGMNNSDASNNQNGNYTQAGSDDFKDQNIWQAGAKESNSQAHAESLDNNGQVRQNMGVNPEETPWHPEEKKPEKEMTGFDSTYFKD